MSAPPPHTAPYKVGAPPERNLGCRTPPRAAHQPCRERAGSGRIPAGGISHVRASSLDPRPPGLRRGQRPGAQPARGEQPRPSPELRPLHPRIALPRAPPSLRGPKPRASQEFRFRSPARPGLRVPPAGTARPALGTQSLARCLVGAPRRQDLNAPPAPPWRGPAPVGGGGGGRAPKRGAAGRYPAPRGAGSTPRARPSGRLAAGERPC